MKKELVMELLALALENKSESTVLAQAGNDAFPFEVGGKYFIRTLTYHCTGKVKAIVGQFLVLEDAAWIADSGPFRQAITEGVLDEVEPVDVPMYLNIASITDAFLWKHKLPREQK